MLPNIAAESLTFLQHTGEIPVLTLSDENHPEFFSVFIRLARQMSGQTQSENTTATTASLQASFFSNISPCCTVRAPKHVVK
jgi:hypothetical protein